VRSRRAGLLLTAVLLLPGCGTSFVDTLAAERSPAPQQPTATPSDGDCAGRAEPDPDRPVVELDFRLADDLRSVTGTETVVCTPDLPTGELILRLVPTAPTLPRPATAWSWTPQVETTSPAAATRTREPRVRRSVRRPAGRPARRRRGDRGGPRLHAHARRGRVRAGGCGRLGVRGRLGPRDPFVDLPGETATSPAAHQHPRLGARGAHRPHDRRPGRALRAAGRPPHLVVGRTGRPGRERRGGRVRHRERQRGRGRGDDRRAARCGRPGLRAHRVDAGGDRRTRGRLRPLPVRDAHRAAAARRRRRREPGFSRPCGADAASG
jgi:hypothetical protein